MVCEVIVNAGQGGGIEIENFVQSYHKNVCVMISWAALYRVHIGPTHVFLLDIKTRHPRHLFEVRDMSLTSIAVLALLAYWAFSHLEIS